MARRTPRRGDRHLDALTDRTRGPFFLHRTYVFSAPAASYNRKRFQKQTAKKRNMPHGTPEHPPCLTGSPGPSRTTTPSCTASRRCDRKRRQAVFEPLGPQFPVDNGEAPLREEAERIAALLDRLPEEQAEVIRLHTFASLRFTEIAQTLQLPASTVKSRFHYGIERLKKLM